jgi:hypothetical protein
VLHGPSPAPALSCILRRVDQVHLTISDAALTVRDAAHTIMAMP